MLAYLKLHNTLYEDISIAKDLPSEKMIRFSEHAEFHGEKESVHFLWRPGCSALFVCVKDRLCLRAIITSGKIFGAVFCLIEES